MEPPCRILPKNARIGRVIVSGNGYAQETFGIVVGASMGTQWLAFLGFGRGCSPTRRQCLHCYHYSPFGRARYRRPGVLRLEHHAVRRRVHPRLGTVAQGHGFFWAAARSEERRVGKE